jgi:hypothetical protein
MPRRRRETIKEEVKTPSPPPPSPPSPPPKPPSLVIPTSSFDRQSLFHLQPRKTPIQVTYDNQHEFMYEVTRLHSKAWDAFLFNDMSLINEFAADVQQLREYFRCHICGDLVSDNALLPMDKRLRHGTICRGNFYLFELLSDQIQYFNVPYSYRMPRK